MTMHQKMNSAIEAYKTLLDRIITPRKRTVAHMIRRKRAGERFVTA